jgi:hypothetical protein
MLTDAALRAGLAAKRAAALEYLGDKYVLANPVNRESLRTRRAKQAVVPVSAVHPLLDVLAEGEIYIGGHDSSRVTAGMNAVERAIRASLDEAAR